MITSAERVNHQRVWRVYRRSGIKREEEGRNGSKALRPRTVLTRRIRNGGDFVSDVAASGGVRALQRGRKLQAGMSGLAVDTCYRADE